MYSGAKGAEASRPPGTPAIPASARAPQVPKPYTSRWRG